MIRAFIIGWACILGMVAVACIYTVAQSLRDARAYFTL